MKVFQLLHRISHHQQIAVLILALLVLANCGVPDAPTGQASAPTVTPPNPTYDWVAYEAGLNTSPTPTRNPEQATANAAIALNQTAVARNWATADALPTPLPDDGRPLETPWPTPTLPTGIGSCELSYRPEDFGARNCWRELQGDLYRTVYAGGRLGQPIEDLQADGAIKVCVLTLSTDKATCSPTQWHTVQDGMLIVTAVNWPHVMVESASGNQYGFNGETQIWEQPQATPPTTTPTNTPTSTPSPTATNTPSPVATATRTPSPVATATRTPSPVATATRTPSPTPASAGTRIKDITFENGNLTDATNGADSTQGSVTLESSAPINGSYAARISTTTESYVREDFATQSDFHATFLVRFDTLPSSSVQFATITDDTNTTIGNIQIRNTGKLRLRIGTTTVGSDSATLQAGTVYRIGLRQTQGSGTNAVLEAYLAEGSNGFGTPFASTTSGTWTSGVYRFRVGPTGSTSINSVIDDIRLDSATMPMP